MKKFLLKYPWVLRILHFCGLTNLIDEDVREFGENRS